MLDDPEDVLGACLKKLGLAVRRDRSRRNCAAPSARPSRRSRCCAPISTPKCATSWWRAMCWRRSSGPPPRSRPSTPRRSWLSLSRRGLSAVLRLRRRPARKPPRASWRTSSWITCCARRLRRDRAVHPDGHRQRRRARAAARAVRSTPSLYPPARRLRTAASGRARCRPPRSACATGSGRKSNRHSGANDGSSLASGTHLETIQS